MATQIDPKELDLQEQLARIRQMMDDSDRARAEQAKVIEERNKLLAEVKFFPASLIFQAMLATAALLGAGAAIAKVFFP